MDVSAATFHYHLPRILSELSTCCFVSLDFEFSGIATGRSGGATSLQYRYDEVKAAAEKYTIVQVGLTIVHEDTQSATYTLQTYNLHLNPIIDRRLDIGRDLCFQAGAAEFLLESNFSMDLLYRDGVPYLSRDEQAQALARAVARQERPVRKDLDVKDTDYESLAFLSAVRRLVDNWVAAGKAGDPFLNIPPPSNPKTKQQSKVMPLFLTSFHKSLVHRLIEVEYPSLVTVSRPSFIQILLYDEEREKAAIAKRLSYSKERILKQAGFRWIVEALTGGDLTELPATCFANLSDSVEAQRRGRSVYEYADDLKVRLKARPPLLVGHNLFSDMIYLWRTFLGPLPEAMTDFQRMVYERVPRLVDTKYMATHECGSINPRSSLQELNDSMMKIPTPVIRIHPNHFKYSTIKVDHEAGYDSMLTAQVFIKLSAQLNQRIAEDPDTSPGVKTVQVKETGTTSRLNSLQGQFDALTVEETTSVTSTNPTANGLLIPQTDEFWQVYGNKLRVFGTEERVCSIP